jgi:hypothetical protein
MDYHKVLSHVLRELDKFKESHNTHLLGGGAKTFDEYRHVCGIIRGLTHAETIVKDLVQKMEYSDE